jgi:hypothetical protein
MMKYVWLPVLVALFVLSTFPLFALSQKAGAPRDTTVHRKPILPCVLTETIVGAGMGALFMIPGGVLSFYLTGGNTGEMSGLNALPGMYFGYVFGSSLAVSIVATGYGYKAPLWSPLIGGLVGAGAAVVIFSSHIELSGGSGALVFFGLPLIGELLFTHLIEPTDDPPSTLHLDGGIGPLPRGGFALAFTLHY